MSRDDDTVDLYTPAHPRLPLRVGGREPVLMRIDTEIAVAVQSLTDYFDISKHNNVIEGTFSILLIALLLEQSDDAVDAFERIITQNRVKPRMDADKLWGEFMTLISFFIDVYENDTVLLEELEILLPSEVRIFPEEIFQVRWSKGGDYLLIQ